jgi:ABC-type dipeptide/oligopeptide/nickel transport system permease component
MLYQSVSTRDYAAVQSLLLISAVCLVVINLMVDIVNSLVDPRIRLE